jgi:hypothetical protein
MESFSLQTLLTWIIAGGAAYLGSYLAAKGKNSARREDLDKILAEVRAVTIAQKEIESKISGEMWQRQWRLNQRLDIYSRLLRALGDYMVWLADVSEAVKLGTGYTTTKQCTLIAEEFHSSYATSALFLSDESVAILEKIRPEFFYHSSLDYSEDQFGDRADRAHDHLAGARKELIASARRDLAR